MESFIDHNNKSINLLIRILGLEKLNSYSNRAVTGGLDEFLRIHKKSLEACLKLYPIKNSSYFRLSPEMRKNWAEKVEEKYSRDRKSILNFSKKNRSKLKSKNALIKNQISSELTLNTPLSDLKFIHSIGRRKLKTLNISTLKDLLMYFPRKHIDYSSVSKINNSIINQETTIIAQFISIKADGNFKLKSTKAIVSDGTGNIQITWFGQPYLSKQFKINNWVVLSGKIGSIGKKLTMDNPEYELLTSGFPKRENLIHAGNFLPIYPSNSDLAQRTIRNAVAKSLDKGIPLIEEFLPIGIRNKFHLVELQIAIKDMHLPRNIDTFFNAKKRLSFDELFLNQLNVLRRKSKRQISSYANSISLNDNSLDTFFSRLEFQLTKDQLKAINEIMNDLDSKKPMGRLLQGEVGSGKTIVALTSLIATAKCGYQGALMVPTEILAEQHFLNIKKEFEDQELDTGLDNVIHIKVPGFEDITIKVGLLIGSLKPKSKLLTQTLIRKHQIDIIIGTHTLIQEKINFPDLSLVVIDEQHRFGVEQRDALLRTKNTPHLLSMSATPIPRSLALTLYGDLELSTLLEIPPGRKPVITKWCGDEESKKYAFDVIREEIGKGFQCFVVCPLIHESEQVRGRSVLTEFSKLKDEIFPEFRIGLLHGEMDLIEKSKIMYEFSNKNIDILVSTQVIEVGIDIPNASSIIIQSSERFGLSQLHQLRGRVGRGKIQGNCFTFSDFVSDQAIERLKIFEKHNDGFHLADQDLRIRGPGDYIGTRQSGVEGFRFASLTDLEMLENVRNQAKEIFLKDPTLSNDSYENLKKELLKNFEDRQLSVS